MKKNAFTLAEVLITLSIIGVIAALTVPSFNNNAGQAKIGAILAKFVNSFETASQTLISESGTNNLISAAETTTSDTDYKEKVISSLQKYLVLADISDTYKFKAGTGTTEKSTTKAYRFDNGSVMAIASSSSVDSAIKDNYGGKGAYKGGIGLIIFDINGTGGKNRAGKDVYAFIIDNSGILVPYASQTYSDLAGETASPVKCDVTKTTIKEGLACTGKIADNNYKSN